MMQVVLIENDINSRPFSSQVLACLPPLPWSVSAEHLSDPNREDLRHLQVFSVDPPGTYCVSCFYVDFWIIYPYLNSVISLWV